MTAYDKKSFEEFIQQLRSSAKTAEGEALAAAARATALRGTATRIEALMRNLESPF